MEFKYPSKQQIIHKYKPIISLHTFVKRQKRSKNSLHIRTPAIQPGTLSFQLHKGWIWMKKTIWVFPKIVVPQNGWFIRENPIKMDDLRVPLFLETPISNQLEFSGHYFLEGKKNQIPEVPKLAVFSQRITISSFTHNTANLALQGLNLPSPGIKYTQQHEERIWMSLVWLLFMTHIRIRLKFFSAIFLNISDHDQHCLAESQESG